MKNHLKPRDLAFYENLPKTHLKKAGNLFCVKKTLIFSQNRKFQFSSPILDGLCVSFKTRHFFMWKQFMCVDCYTGKFTLSNIFLHKRAIGWTLVASQAEMRKDECMTGVVAYEWNLIVIKLLKRSTLIHPWFWSPKLSSKILGLNNKSFQGFLPLDST